MVPFNAYYDRTFNDLVSNSLPTPNIPTLEFMKSLIICINKLECSVIHFRSGSKISLSQEFMKWIWLDKGRESGLKLYLHSPLHKNEKMSVELNNWERSVENGEDYGLAWGHYSYFYPAITFIHSHIKLGFSFF